VDDVGIKIFKCTSDARREVRKLIPFHLFDLTRLPGIPNQHALCSLHAGILTDTAGAERGFIVQEWATGATLDEWAAAGKAGMLTGTQLPTLVCQLFLGIIIPLWHKGTIWWDIRDANFVFCDRRNWLTMIDADSLAAYSGEILDAPTKWDAREKGRRTALARLRQMMVRLVVAYSGTAKGNSETEVRAAWTELLEPALQCLGRKPGQDEICRSGVDGFIRRLEKSGLLGAE
jgi:hypothetical protein